jgi:hypothetical protein
LKKAGGKELSRLQTAQDGDIFHLRNGEGIKFRSISYTTQMLSFLDVCGENLLFFSPHSCNFNSLPFTQISSEKLLSPDGSLWAGGHN